MRSDGIINLGRSAKPVNRTVVLSVVCLGSFIAALMSSSVNIAIPSIGRELSIDAITLSWVATVFLLATAVVLVPIGKAADVYGRKRVFLISAVAWTATSLLYCADWHRPRRR